MPGSSASLVLRSTAMVIASARSGRVTSTVATIAVGAIGSEADGSAAAGSADATTATDWSRAAMAVARSAGTAGVETS